MSSKLGYAIKRTKSMRNETHEKNGHKYQLALLFRLWVCKEIKSTTNPRPCPAEDETTKQTKQSFRWRRLQTSTTRQTPTKRCTWVWKNNNLLYCKDWRYVANRTERKWERKIGATGNKVQNKSNLYSDDSFRWQKQTLAPQCLAAGGQYCGDRSRVY